MNDIYYPVAHRTQDEIDALKIDMIRLMQRLFL